MFQKLISTKDEITLLVIRITVGFIMFAHGAQKLPGWFGGDGPALTVEKWNKWFNLPPAVTLLFILAEFFAPLFLIFGFLSRIMAGVIIIIMLGAMYYVTFKWGFYMNWYSNPNRGEGFEMHLLVIAICTAIVIKGGGRFSIDRRLMKSDDKI